MNSTNHCFLSTTAEPSVGELRFIARLSRTTLPNGPIQSTIYDGTAIEASDVYLVDGETRSKCTLRELFHSISLSNIFFNSLLFSQVYR
jgi:hypothetical protein